MKNLTVLCVEDDEFARNEMVHFLKKRVGKVYEASNGVKGLDMIKFYRPDAVIVDLLMPEMDGKTMIKTLRHSGDRSHIVVATSVNSVDSVVELYDMGIDGYIIKPIDFAELEIKLEKIRGDVEIERGGRSGILNFIDDKHALEDAVKGDFIKTIKEFTGRGPRDAIVQFYGDKVIITAFEVLSVMEKNLLKNIRNYEVVKQLRNVIYESISGRMAESISMRLDLKISYEKANINLKKGIDQMIFKTNDQ